MHTGPRPAAPRHERETRDETKERARQTELETRDERKIRERERERVRLKGNLADVFEQGDDGLLQQRFLLRLLFLELGKTVVELLDLFVLGVQHLVPGTHTNTIQYNTVTYAHHTYM